MRDEGSTTDASRLSSHVSDWPAMLRAALRMGVAPEAFWRLSLKEWRMLTSGEAQPVMGRADFERLMEVYG